MFFVLYLVGGYIVYFYQFAEEPGEVKVQVCASLAFVDRLFDLFACHDDPLSEPYVKITSQALVAP